MGHGVAHPWVNLATTQSTWMAILQEWQLFKEFTGANLLCEEVVIEVDLPDAHNLFSQHFVVWPPTHYI